MYRSILGVAVYLWLVAFTGCQSSAPSRASSTSPAFAEEQRLTGTALSLEQASVEAEAIWLAGATWTTVNPDPVFLGSRSGRVLLRWPSALKGADPDDTEVLASFWLRSTPTYSEQPPRIGGEYIWFLARRRDRWYATKVLPFSEKNLAAVQAAAGQGR